MFFICTLLSSRREYLDKAMDFGIIESDIKNKAEELPELTTSINTRKILNLDYDALDMM
jgi:hypothetical protein